MNKEKQFLVESLGKELIEMLMSATTDGICKNLWMYCILLKLSQN